MALTNFSTLRFSYRIRRYNNAIHGMNSVRQLRQKSLHCVNQGQECGPIFFVVKIELKRVFKVPILVTIDAANSVSVELKKVEFYLYFTLIKTAKK